MEEGMTLDVSFAPKDGSLWRIAVVGDQNGLAFTPPVVELDGEPVTLNVERWELVGEPLELGFGGVRELRYRGQIAACEGLTLEADFRLAAGSPIVRFRYTLASTTERQMTKSTGRDRIDYYSFSAAGLPDVTEVQLTNYNELVHSYCLAENDVPQGFFDNGLDIFGPILTAGNPSPRLFPDWEGQGLGSPPEGPGAGSGRKAWSPGFTYLVAYEHGSTVPDAFLSFRLAPDRTVTLRAVKGNYYAGRVIGPTKPYRTIWMQAGGVAGSREDMAAVYRCFVLESLSPNRASREPYIFYNSWAYQERNKWWRKRTFIESMNEERMLAEIDVAHEMGIDVFVLDTGWYEKTGDWRVSTIRFPKGLSKVREKLDGYGMKLGLWFDPTAAAQTSRMLADRPQCRMTSHGKLRGPHEIWETEASYGMCLVSDYADAFAEELIRLVREVGVTYFKWDAIEQYGCDDPGHHHGAADNDERERADCFAFELCLAMAHVVDRLCAAEPSAIVDFDITERGRCVGLSFLASGKYFLVNNGPYYQNFDHPFGWNVPQEERERMLATTYHGDEDVLFKWDAQWSNVFVHPGPARGWVARSPLGLDKWIPSVLFLTHYLPDDPESSQWINIGSLILGQNGIWGDLLTVPREGVARFAEALAAYKAVRYEITAAYPVRMGPTGGSPEVHEKILLPQTASEAGRELRGGRGAVVVFANIPGRYVYVTHAHVARENVWTNPGVDVTFDPQGRAVMTVTLDRPGAGIAIFR